jgi:microcystin-dependent protein
MEGVIGVVTWFAADFVPRNWALCDGTKLPVATNQALFSIIGNTYGGDGKTNFALPDMRGRYPVSAGQAPGLSPYVEGQAGGAFATILQTANLPQHNHSGSINIAMDVSGSDGIINRAQNTYAAGAPDAYSDSPTSYMAEPAYQVTMGIAGQSAPVSLMMPYLVVNYIICTAGIFPSRQ